MGQVFCDFIKEIVVQLRIMEENCYEGIAG